MELTSLKLLDQAPELVTSIYLLEEEGLRSIEAERVCCRELVMII